MQPLIVAMLWSAMSASAQQFVGSAPCAECHLSIFQLHSDSPHASALQPVLSTDLPRLLQERPIREGNGTGYHYLERVNGLEIAVTQAGKRDSVTAASGLLEWVFGGGAQGRTLVGRTGGRWFEHRVSYYSQPDKLAITLGHALEPPRRPAAAVGRRLSNAEALLCFNCHATGVRTGFNGPDLSRMTAGVQCERCHGPGAKHVSAARAGDPQRARTTIEARRAAAADTLEFCGQCHRSEEKDLRPNDPLNVRFQPIGLARSRCFQRSEALTCTSCHDPHQAVQKDAARYSVVCSSCHAEADLPDGCGRDETSSCLPCHMPRRQATPYLEFTDHHIRVHGR